MIRASVSGLLSLLILAAVSPATAGDVSADEVSIATYQAAIKVNSLDEAIAAALANEPQLLAKDSMVGLAEARLKSAKADGKSQIGINGTYGISHAKIGVDGMIPFKDFSDIYPRSLAIAWERRLYDGGASLAKVSEADFNLAAENGEYKNARNQLVVDVVSAYSDVAVAYQGLQFAKDNLTAVERFAHDAGLMFKAGEIPVSEKAGADARLAQAQAQYAGAEAQASMANANLLRLTNRAIENPVFVNKAPQLPASEQHAREFALENHPLLAAGRARVEAAKAMVKAANANYLPQVSAQVRGATIRDQFLPGYKQDEVGAYLNFSMPLYTSGKISSGVSQARYGLEAATRANQATERAINMGISQSYAGFYGAMAQVKAANAALDARLVAMKSVEAEMRVGERPMADVLDAQKNLTEAKMEVAKANAALLVAKYRIVAAMGGDIIN